MNRRPPPALLLAVLLALLVVAGELVPTPAVRAPAASSVPVVASEAVCPDLRQVPPELRTRVSAGAASTSGGTGSADGRALARTSAPVPLALTRPGEVAVGLAQELDGDALLVRARGALAAGLEVEQVTRGSSGSQRGLAALRCEGPRTEGWWVGGATTVGDSTVLLLTNPDDTPAVVDVQVQTASGRVDARPGRGIEIGAHARTAVPLDRLAPDRDLLAVHVRATQGRFAAGVRHARFDGRVPRGSDWVPPAGTPSRTVVVAGLPAGPGRRTVLVANPGTEDTVVSLQLATADGLVTPPGLEAVTVPAGLVVAQELTEQLAATPASVRVVSEGGPVLACGLVVDAQYARPGVPEGPVRELAWTGAAAALRGPALLTDVVLDRPTESTLLLTAFDGDARVQVAPVRVVGVAGALPRPRTVAVAAGRTVAVKLSSFLPPGATGRLAVEVRPLPGSAPVQAARYLRERGVDGPLSTLLVLRSVPGRVARPAVVRDPAAGVF
ncbi:MAG: hypothetical protein JWM64_865 [Frankiales bacterium]|nr:hypothetical protein [Frankiales bacterium]